MLSDIASESLSGFNRNPHVRSLESDKMATKIMNRVAALCD